jgi:hypothetical protein
MDAEVLEVLRAREPIFHHPDEFGASRADFEAQTVEDYWEIGASGRRYDRESIWATLERRYAENADDPWTIEAFEGRQLGPDTYLVTYILEQPGPRRTRRATIWRAAETDWQALYHQGTIMPDGE